MQTGQDGQAGKRPAKRAYKKACSRYCVGMQILYLLFSCTYFPIRNIFLDNGPESCPDCCQRIGYIRNGSQCKPRTMWNSIWQMSVSLQRCYCTIPPQGRPPRLSSAQSNSRIRPGQASSFGSGTANGKGFSAKSAGLPFRRYNSKRT